MKRRETRICPVCNSQDVELDDTFKWEQGAGIIRHACNNCGYSGTMATIPKEHADKLKVLTVRK